MKHALWIAVLLGASQPYSTHGAADAPRVCEAVRSPADGALVTPYPSRPRTRTAALAGGPTDVLGRDRF